MFWRESFWWPPLSLYVKYLRDVQKKVTFRILPRCTCSITRDLHKLPTQGEAHARTKGDRGRLEFPFWFGKHCDSWRQFSVSMFNAWWEPPRFETWSRNKHRSKSLAFSQINQRYQFPTSWYIDQNFAAVQCMILWDVILFIFWVFMIPSKAFARLFKHLN